MRLTRRGFVKLVGTGAAIAACGDNIKVTTSGLFFGTADYESIDIATDIVFPGARDAQAVRYIDTLLAAYESSPPTIFASGPYSGRTPFPDANGAPSTSFPADSFAAYLPLTRIQDIAWQIRIFGSAATTGGDFNDALLGATVGYRDLYTDGLARLDAVAATLQPNATFRSLGASDQGLALDTVASDAPKFYQALVEHTLEGTFAAPEYGGNTLLSGWKLAQYDGDSAPLGHAFYDATTDSYIDNPTQPTSTASPGAKREDFDDDIIDVLTVAAIGSGGKRFF